MYYVWHKKYSDLDLWKGEPTRGKFPSSLDRRVMLVYLFVSFKNTHTHTHIHTHSIMTQSNKCAKRTSWNSRYFKSLEPMIVPSCKNLFSHRSLSSSTNQWNLHFAENFITWCQNTTSTKETTIPTLPNPSNSHYAPPCDSFHLMIVHMFVAAFCWSAPHINLAYSRRSDCGESLQGDVSRKNIRGMG